MPCDAPVMTATFCSIPMVISCCFPAPSGQAEPMAASYARSLSERIPSVRQTLFREAIEWGIMGGSGGALDPNRDRGGTMDRIDAMKVFVVALDIGSLAGAGRKLGRSPAAVSRAIAFL